MGIAKYFSRLRRLIARRPIISLVVLLLVVLAILELTNTTHLLHKQKAVSGTIPSSNIETQNSSTNQSQASTNTSNQTPVETPKSQPINATDTNAFLLEPSGTFASYHRPSLSGNSAPSKETSSCHTTAGATCTIIFTQNGATKTLAAQKTDADGNTFWEWDVKGAGFTTGTWKISATATLGSQTKTVNDTLTLDVQP